MVIVAPRYPEASGGSRYVENLGAALAEIGVDVSVISVYPGTGRTALKTSAVIAREQLHRYPAFRGRKGAKATLIGALRLVYKRWDARRYRHRFRVAMESYGAESVIIFTHAVAKLMLDETGFVSEESKAMLIGQHHSSFESLNQEPGLRDQILRAFGDIDAFTALSVEDAAEFATLLNVPCYGVDNVAARSAAPAAGAGGRARTAVALVRLSHEKQVDVMMRAFMSATSVSELRDWRLEIYGEGELREELERLIESLDARNRIRLCGLTDEPAEALSGASLNLLTSRYEGFGYAVLEAAQVATPSIAFDCSPGLHRLMVTVDGHLVPPSAGERGYAAALRDLLLDPHALAERGESARIGTARFSGPVVLGEWAHILDQVDGRRE
ncbi:MAG: glycosyltransferase [Actinobacteria bacterium]|nr:glycosyltransferase [Actinomycetota bacterium]